MSLTMTEKQEPAAAPAAAAACQVCHVGRRGPGTTTMTLERDGAVLVVKHVPATVCDTCGDATLAVDVVRELERQLRAAIAAGVSTDVREYHAA